jgi:hypothetical protein
LKQTKTIQHIKPRGHIKSRKETFIAISLYPENRKTPNKQPNDAAQVTRKERANQTPKIKTRTEIHKDLKTTCDGICIIKVLRRLRKEDCKLKASLCHRATQSQKLINERKSWI